MVYVRFCGNVAVSIIFIVCLSILIVGGFGVLTKSLFVIDQILLYNNYFRFSLPCAIFVNISTMDGSRLSAGISLVQNPPLAAQAAPHVRRLKTLRRKRERQGSSKKEIVLETVLGVTASTNAALSTNPVSGNISDSEDLVATDWSL